MSVISAARAVLCSWVATPLTGSAIQLTGWRSRIKVKLYDDRAPGRSTHRTSDDVPPEPGRERLRVAKLVKVAPRREESILDDVFGIGPGTEQDGGRAERGRQERLHEAAEGIPVASHSGRDEARGPRRRQMRHVFHSIRWRAEPIRFDLRSWRRLARADSSVGGHAVAAQQIRPQGVITVTPSTHCVSRGCQRGCQTASRGS